MLHRGGSFFLVIVFSETNYTKGLNHPPFIFVSLFSFLRKMLRPEECTQGEFFSRLQNRGFMLIWQHISLLYAEIYATTG
jgi:hypothetical protein